MNSGVPRKYRSPRGDCLAVSQHPFLRVRGAAFRAGLLMLGSLLMLIFASSALGAPAPGCGAGPVKTPTVVPEAPAVPVLSAPVVTPPSAPATTTPAGGETVAKPTAPLPATVAPAVRPPIRSVTKAKKPTEKFVTTHASKHHLNVRHGHTERSLARPVLRGRRPAFTG